MVFLQVVSAEWIIWHSQFQKSLRGSAVVEYGLAGALILLVSISALIHFSGHLQANLQGVQGKLSGQGSSPVGLLDTQAVDRNSVQQVALSPEKLALLQSSLATKLQTTGANGSTKILAEQIELAAQTMLDKGTINQAQYDILVRLANQAHEVARIEGMVEQAVQHAQGNQQVFNEMKLNYNGQVYSAPDLSLLVGVSWQTPQSLAGTDILQSTQLMGGMAPVQALYQEALEGGALDDPALKATVDSATAQIMQIGELSENAVYNFSVYGDPLSNAESLHVAMAQQSTDFQATNICRSGGFSDTGVLCSP